MSSQVFQKKDVQMMGKSRPILLEILEPRIMLSGYSLLNIAASESFRDPFLDNMEQNAQYVKLLDTTDQVEEQIKSELALIDILNNDGFRPDDIYYNKKPKKPKRDSKTVPCNIEQHLFRETRMTGYRLKAVA